jgi:hypothetical protein
MSKWPMRGHFRYLRFKTFQMTPRTPQCEVFLALLLNSKHSGVPEDSKSPTLEVLGFTPHTWPKWGCDIWHQCPKVSFVYNYCVWSQLARFICVMGSHKLANGRKFDSIIVTIEKLVFKWEPCLGHSMNSQVFGI